MKTKMAKQLTKKQINNFYEIMRTHMDKNQTYGRRSQILIERIINQSNVLATDKFPKAMSVLYPMANQAVIQDTIGVMNRFGQNMTDWGQVLMQLGAEYAAMMKSLQEFLDTIPDPEEEEAS